MKRGRSKNIDINEIRDGKLDMVKILASTSEYSQETISNVYDLIIGYIHMRLTMRTCPDNIKISFKGIGNFILKKKKGMKAGSTYFSPSFDDEGNFIQSESRKVLEEDKPDYLRPYFEFSTKFTNEIRKRSEVK